MKAPNRTRTLLRAAYDLILRTYEAPYLLSAPDAEICYDEDNHTGMDLMNDIAELLDLDEGEQPIPLVTDDGEPTCWVCGERETSCVCTTHLNMES